MTIGLVDGNNFYVSVERIWDPRLHGKPVVIASSNDGCAIARSNEAKALGIKMGQPLHELPSEVRRQTIVRSANFQLYGQVSQRIVSILRDLFPRVEIYSIDESFVSFDGIPEDDHERIAAEARARILKWTDIPTCVGISSTKTLAKSGNKLAKKTPHGVVKITNAIRQLENYDVGDVWGVGPRFAARLSADGILTAADLMRADSDTLQSRYGVVLARTQRELQGIACSDLVELEDVPDQKQIMVSRSFGQEVTSAEDLAQSISTFAQRACEKLRSRQLQAAGVWVFCHTNPFKPHAPQYSPSKAFNFIRPTTDTREVLMVAQGLIRAMWRPGYRFKKAGIGLLDLSPTSVQQGDLFNGVDPRAGKLMTVMDEVNAKFGRKMGFASSGWRPGSKGLRQPVWTVKRDALSPAYMSKWDQLLKVH